MPEFPYYAEYNTAFMPIRTIVKSKYKNHDYAIYSMNDAYPTAYVKLKKHEYNPEGYDYYNHIVLPEFSPHGGFTYYGTRIYNKDPIYKQGKVFWLGWDYAHAFDYFSRPFAITPNTVLKRWTIEEIIKDCEKVIDFLELK